MLLLLSLLFLLSLFNEIGDVVNDLTNVRRGFVSSVDTLPDMQHALVRAEVPLVSMMGYASALRSATAGSASFHMQFRNYALLGARNEARILHDLRGY